MSIPLHVAIFAVLYVGGLYLLKREIVSTQSHDARLHLELRSAPAGEQDSLQLLETAWPSS